MNHALTITRWLLALCVVVALHGCSQKPEVVQNSLFAFGTLVDVSMYADDDRLVQQANAVIQQDLEYMHFAWHAWQPGPLGRVNMLLETTATFTVNPSVLPLLIESQRLSKLSQGLFNPAIGHLIKLWGFHGDMGPAADTPPAETEIKKWLAQHPSMDDIEIKHTQVRSHNPAVKLDMGAVGKGYALDRIVEHLQELGIKNMIINAGGDLKAIGRHPERPWRVGIRHPRRENGVLAALDVHDNESVFTSGDYERFFDFNGKRYHHIIDPRSGYPATGCQSVTVITQSGALADAAATALFVAGREEWPAIASAMGIDRVLYVDQDGKLQATQKMLQRLQLSDAAPAVQIRDLP